MTNPYEPSAAEQTSVDGTIAGELAIGSVSKVRTEAGKAAVVHLVGRRIGGKVIEPRAVHSMRHEVQR